MSLHHTLKAIDTPLRGAMNRRDRLKRNVAKHARQVETCTSKIKRAEDKLEKLKDTTAENIAMWTDEIELHQGYKDISRANLEEAESEVNVRLDELGAV